MPPSVTNPLKTLVGYQLRRASALLMDGLGEDLSGVGLRPITASIILIIGANSSIKPSEVGRELGIQRANITPLIAALERDGLVRRHVIDGRSHGLQLTPAGEAAQLNALRMMWRSDEALLARLSPPERLQFAHLLSRLWDEA